MNAVSVGVLEMQLWLKFKNLRRPEKHPGKHTDHDDQKSECWI